MKGQTGSSQEYGGARSKLLAFVSTLCRSETDRQAPLCTPTLVVRVLLRHSSRSLLRMSSPTRLFLNEVVARWSGLSLVDVYASNGNRERLVELLRAQYSLSQNCAAREVDTMLADFAARLRCAKAA
jgi:hypothetical protein